MDNNNNKPSSNPSTQPSSSLSDNPSISDNPTSSPVGVPPSPQTQAPRPPQPLTNPSSSSQPQSPKVPSPSTSSPYSPPKPSVESAILPPLGKKTIDQSVPTPPSTTKPSSPPQPTTSNATSTHNSLPITNQSNSQAPTPPVNQTSSTQSSTSPSSTFSSAINNQSTPSSVSSNPSSPPTPSSSNSNSLSSMPPVSTPSPRQSTPSMQGVVSEAPKTTSDYPPVPQTTSTPQNDPQSPSAFHVPSSSATPLSPSSTFSSVSNNKSPLSSDSSTPTSSPSPSNANSQPPMPPAIPPSATNLPTSSSSPSTSVITSSNSSSGKGKLIGFLIFLLIVVLGGAGAAYWFLFRPSTGPQTDTGPTTITYWGLWEPEEVMKPIIEEYQQQNPNIKINYENSSPTEYAQRLRNALASNTPPDIFRMHNTWPYMFPNLLSTVPEDIYTQEEYSQTFYPVASKNLTVDGKLVGIPLMYDGLALFYNVELFNRAGIENPPTDWEQFMAVARKITAPQTGNLEISGAAMGVANNIAHWPDILSLLLLQNDANPGDLLAANGQLNSNATDALTFYSLFSYRHKTWDATWPQDNQQFALGKVGMFFGPSWEVFNIKNIANRNNVDIDFRVIPVPQLLPDTNVTFASYWVEGVSAKSTNQSESWKFLKYLSSKEVMQKMYQEQSKIREFGEIPSRKDMADQFMDDPYIGAYLKQAPAAKSFPLVSSTTDKDGINDQINKAYEQAVTVASKGTSASSALQPTSNAVIDVLRTYGLAQ